MAILQFRELLQTTAEEVDVLLGIAELLITKQHTKMSNKSGRLSIFDPVVFGNRYFYQSHQDNITL